MTPPLSNIQVTPDERKRVTEFVGPGLRRLKADAQFSDQGLGRGDQREVAVPDFAGDSECSRPQGDRPIFRP